MVFLRGPQPCFLGRDILSDAGDGLELLKAAARLIRSLHVRLSLRKRPGRLTIILIQLLGR